MHDLRRVYELACHFNVSTAVCVNKADINPDNVAEIEAFCSNNKISIAGAIPYDTDVTRAQIAGKSVVEHSNGPAAQAIEKIWNYISEIISGNSQ